MPSLLVAMPGAPKDIYFMYSYRLHMIDNDRELVIGCR